MNATRLLHTWPPEHVPVIFMWTPFRDRDTGQMVCMERRGMRLTNNRLFVTDAEGVNGTLASAPFPVAWRLEA